MTPAIPSVTGGASSAKSGDLFGGSSVFGGGDWNVSTGSGDAGGLSSTTVAIIAGAGVLLWLLMRKKS